MKQTLFPSSSFLRTLSIGTLSVLACSAGFAAEREELSLSKMQTSQYSIINQTSQFTGFLRMEAASGLKEIDKRIRKDGTVHYRFQQTYQGVPVYGDHILITTTKAGSPMYLSGSVVKGIAADVGNAHKNLIDEAEALKIAKQLFQSKQAVKNIDYDNEQVSLYVDLDDNNKATYMYEVNFFTVVNGKPTRPFYIINAQSGKLIRHYEGLNTATAGGPGGNQRMGRIEYGSNGTAPLDITQSGTLCYLENNKVRVVDMQGTESNATSPAVSYYCGSDNYHNEYEDNGNYGYNNDALFGGTAFVDMMQSWYGEPALPFKLIQRTNFGQNYANAFWDGSKMTYGDGGSTFHHMDSFGVIGHEVAHGYTQYHSNLVYAGQSGGINESFSDMAGEALKFYLFGENDFLVGSLLKKYSGFMRNMKNPPADGYSIDHTSKYYPGIDVHHSSGVFNKAFYLLATSSGWDTRKAFEVFLIANRDYWRPNDTYQSAGEGVCQAASFLNVDGAAVKAALNAVGMTASACGSSTSTPTELKDGDVKTISGGDKANFRYYINVPTGATALTITTSGNNGDADLYLKFGSDPSDSDYDCGSFGETSNESCTVDNPQPGEWRVLVHAWAAINNIQVSASLESQGNPNSEADVQVSLVGATGKTQKAENRQGFIRYKAVITNNGPDAASGVELRNIFPAGVQLRSINPAKGQCSNDGVTCSIGDLQVNETVEVIIEVGVNDTEKRQFGATITSTSTDTDTDNNLDAEKFGGALGLFLIALLGLGLLRRTMH